MKRNLLLLVSIMTLVFSSCQKEEYQTDAGIEKEDVTLLTSISPRTEVMTRAAFGHEGDGKGSFSNGDQISLYITPEGGNTLRQTATFDGTSWTFDDKALSWGDIKGRQVTFTAFYPAIDTPTDGEYVLKCETNQEFSNMLERSDKVLLSSTTVSPGQPVRLNFHHAMHYLEVNLSSVSPHVSENDIKLTEIRVNAFAEVGIDPATGRITGTKGDRKDIRLRSQNSSKFRAVLCPQPILEDWQTRSWLTMKIQSSQYSYKAPLTFNNGAEFNSLESGKKFTLNLQIGKKDVVIEDLTDKTIWVNGLKNIPSQTLWGIAYMEMGTLGLKYDPGYGWYDIKKKDATAPTYGDHRLCWAATCSNMIHWWYDRNKENVECYFNYKRATDPDYIFPSFSYDKNTHKESGVFEFFKQTVTDKGGYVPQGLKWFLRGEWIQPANNDSSGTEDNETSRKHRDQGGFFGEVYKDSAIEEIWQGWSGSYQAGDFIKNALNRGDVLGIDHQSMNGNHAITLWGAAFDDQREVTTLYVCDNNHSDAELNQGGGVMVPGKLGPYGIFQMRIKKKANGYYYLESSAKGTYTVEISGLESMSQGEVAWKRFWEKHPDYAPKKP